MDRGFCLFVEIIAGTRPMGFGIFLRRLEYGAYKENVHTAGIVDFFIYGARGRILKNAGEMRECVDC